MFTLCHYILNVHNLLSIFTGARSHEFALSLKGNFGPGLLGNPKTVKTMRTFRDGTKAFFFVRGCKLLGVRGAMLWFRCE